MLGQGLDVALHRAELVVGVVALLDLFRQHGVADQPGQADQALAGVGVEALGLGQPVQDRLEAGSGRLFEDRLGGRLHLG